MPTRQIDPRRVKTNRSYDTSELVERLDVHPNTVRQWRRDGLTPLDGTRPYLFHGSTVRSFLARRNTKRKSPCPPGTIYCFRCRAPRPPALGMVDFLPITTASGNVRAICGTCETVMYRRARWTAVGAILPGCEVREMEAPPHLRERPQPSLHSDSRPQGAIP